MPQPDRGSDDTEVEWQFDALDLRPVERWLAGAGAPAEGDGTAVVAESRPARRLTDTYLDTADWRLGRAGFVLRVRQRAATATEVTLKDRAESVEGLRRRLEVTEPLPTGDLAALGRSGPVGRRLHALAGSRTLQAVLEVRTRRRPYALRIGGQAVGEVALDDTVIAVPGDPQPVRLRRVEVEVAPATEAVAAPVVERLRVQCGLQPASLSKFEAGLLGAGVQIPSPAELGPTTLPASPTVGDLAFSVLRRHFGVMLAHEAGTRLGEDPEELHDMRVATRRMRAALALFAEALPARAAHVRVELGWLADCLGAVRDLDVQLERLAEWMTEVPPDDAAALTDLAALLHRHRDVARDHLLTALESHRYERLVNGFATMLRQGPSRRLAGARAPAVLVVPDLLRSRHRAVVKAAKRAARSGAPDDFHKLRIRGKRLRYALEFVAPLYPGQTPRYVKRVVALQDALGLMQDARVAAEWLHQLVLDEGSQLSLRTVFVMGGVAERYRQESRRLARRVPAHMDSLTSTAWHRLIGHADRRRLEATPIYGWPARHTAVPPTATPAPGEAAAGQPSPASALPGTDRPSEERTAGAVVNGSVNGRVPEHPTVPVTPQRGDDVEPPTPS